MRRKFKLDIDKLNPFFRNFCNRYSKVTEAPPEFILTSLLPSLGAAIGLNRWIQWGGKKIYPNVWSMIIGPSTRVRKSTALDIALSANEALDFKFPGRSFLLPADGSMAAFLDALGEEKHGVLKHSEIATLFENMDKGYNSNMKSLFTGFFDVPSAYKVRLKKDGVKVINDPIFSIATATTLAWLHKNITSEDMFSGFIARFLMCYQDKKGTPIPIPMQLDTETQSKIFQKYEHLINLKPQEIDITGEFNEYYSKFYLEMEEMLDDPLLDERTKSLLARLQTDYFAKQTIIDCTLMGVTEAKAETAQRVQYLISFFAAQAKMVMENLRKTDVAKNEEKVLLFLEKVGNASSTELHRLFGNNLKSNQLNSIMRTLEDAGEVFSKKDGRVTIYQLLSPVGREN